MSSSLNKHHRIKIACLELENAIQNFEDDSEAILKAEKEAQKLQELKKTLSEIKRQLEELSN